MMMQNDKMAYVLDETAILRVLFRVAVKERKELAPLTDYLTAILTPCGYDVEGYEWNQKANCGIILISYKGDKIRFNNFGEANMLDLNYAASYIEEKVDFYFATQRFAKEHAAAAMVCMETAIALAQPIKEVPEDDAPESTEDETDDDDTPISLFLP